MTAIRLSRRSFLLGGICMGFGVPGRTAAAPREAGLTLWVRLDTDGIVTIRCPAAEIGQGSRTVMPMILAEEMDADWSLVRAETAPYDRAFANPGFVSNGAPRLVTADSTTTPGYWQTLRLAGAQARALLIGAAAERWDLPAASLTTEAGQVLAPDGRRLGYGEIAGFLRVPRRLPEIGPGDLKPLAQFRLIGQSPGRLDGVEKIDGTAVYGVDATMPDMLVATVEYPPRPGAEPVAIDARAAEAVPGVYKVVPLPGGVGVVADTLIAARKGRAALGVTWSEGPADGYDSDAARAEFLRIAADPGTPGVVNRSTGDVAEARAGAARILTADFASAHVTHACLEPMTALVRTHTLGRGAVAVVPTQSQDLDMRLLARTLKTPPMMIDIRPVYAGGGFGRRVENRVVADAALMSRATGRPVKVVQSLSDDLRHGIYRPLAAQHLEASLDARGRITGWSHRIVADSAYARMFPEQFAAAGGMDRTVTDGQAHLYAIPNQHLDYVRQDRGIPVGYLRSVGGGYTVWAIEQVLDRIARATGQDPLALRLSLLTDARALRVLEAVAEMAGWGSRPLGLAFSAYRGTMTAVVAELDPAPPIRVRRYWAAVDPGLAIHPGNVVAQIEGALIMGTSLALAEAVPFTGGAAGVSGLQDYPLLRLSGAPDIAVRLIQTPDLGPQGVGESGVPPAAAAIANAALALWGQELGDMPFAA